MIDPVSGKLFVVARPGGQNILARIDLITGAVESTVVLRSYPRAGPVFDATKNIQRPGLLLSRGVIFIGFGSLSEGPTDDYHGWVLAYDAAFDSASPPLDSFCTTPSTYTASTGATLQNVGGGIWQAGNGLATDSAGSAIFFETGNAYQLTWSNQSPLPQHAPVDFEDSFVRIPIATNAAPGGVFLPAAKHPATNPRNLTEFYDVEQNDQDLGSSGPLILPGGRLIGGGKTGIFYVLRTGPDASGALLTDVQAPFQAFWNAWDPSDNATKIWAKQVDRGPHIHGAPVLWSRPSSNVSPLYAWSELDHLKRFDYDPVGGTVKPTSAQSAQATRPAGDPIAGTGRMAGGMLSISANGATPGSAIVWAIHNDGNAVDGPATGHVYAFDAETLGAPLWQDRVPMASKFTPPTVANGKVYVASFGNELRVYGLRMLDPTTGVMSLPTSAPARDFCSGTSKRIYTGDFDGDGRGDFLCHDPDTGGKAIAFAPRRNAPMNGDWVDSTMTWCLASPLTPSPQLTVADFDGDGRADMLCHDKSTGHDYFAYAALDGTFSGTSYAPSYTWCNTSSKELLVGDFDGNGRVDLLCHDRANGGVTIKYAGGLHRATDGEFDGYQGTASTYPDWVQPSFGWCYGANAALKVGDFNGDGMSDLLCHDTQTGYKWVIFALDDVKRFPGSGSATSIVAISDWQASMSWCMGGSALSVADFNGDGADDIYCHDAANGASWIDYANPSRTSSQPLFPAPLGTSSVTDSAGWCFLSPYTPSPVLVLSDVDGDRRADVVCYDTATAKTFVAYSPVAP